MVASRFGGENITVGMDGYVAFWFPPEDLGIAFAVLHTIGRCGTAVHFIIMPYLYDVFHSLALPLWTSFFLYGALILLCLIVIFMSNKAEREGRICLSISNEEGDSIVSLMFGCRFYSLKFWILALLCGVFYSGMFIFMSIASGFFQTRFHFDNVGAGYLHVRFIL